MFLRLDDNWMSAAKAYCYQYPLETLEISYYLMRRAQLAAAGDKRNGRLYGYLVDEQLTALLFFNDKGIMYISNQSPELFAKVDFLKAIRRENPMLIRGRKEQVERVFYFLQRALKQFKFAETLLLAAPNAMPSGEQSAIVAANTIDWQRHAPFLVAVEKQFRNRPLIMNNLRNRLNGATALNLDFYSVYCAGERPIGQVVGEFSTWQYGIIGGLYVSPERRRSQLGSSLLAHAVKQYGARNLAALLYVAADNAAALALYDKLGFKLLLKTMDLTIAL